jgi:integrase
MAKSSGYTRVEQCIRSYVAADGTVSYRVSVWHRGRYVTETWKRRGDARRRRDEIRSELRGGRSVEGYRTRLAEAIALYQAARERGEISRPLEGRDATLEWWLEVAGADRLHELSAPRIRGLLQRLMDGGGPSGGRLAGATANRYLSALSAVLSYAASTGLMPYNAARLVQRMGEGASPGRELATDERRRLLAAARADADWRIHPMVVIAMFNGPRQSEILRLAWPQVDFRGRSAELLRTKSGRRRSLPLFERSLEVLQAVHRSRRRVDTELVFGPGRLGQSPFPRDAWYRVREAAEIAPEADGRAYRFHGLRHDCACRLARSGASDSEIMLIMGWESRSMLETYTHLRPDVGRPALEAMGRRFLAGLE